MEIKDIESQIEGILFAAGEPVGIDRLCASLELDRQTIKAVAQRLADGYSFERRGIRLIWLEDSIQLCSAPEHAELIRRTFETRKPPQLSQPALEVLAIVAYFQPVTRAYVDQIRGVDCSYTMGLLLERGLIEECGRLSVPGRPMQFRTTKEFLRCFHLKDLGDLPEFPGTLPEDGQIALDMQAKIDQLSQQGEADPEVAVP